MRRLQSELRIGDWWCPCCLHDLSHITNAEELEDAKSFDCFGGGWDNVNEAVADLSKACDANELDEVKLWYSGEGDCPEIVAALDAM